MKIRCECGTLISDNTDWLSYKASFVADQDWEDVLYPDADQRDDGSAEGGRSRAVADDLVEGIRERLDGWSRSMWQCPDCGVLFLEDRDHRVHRFAPLGTDAPRDLLGSIHGEQWKRPLRGSWRLSACCPEQPGELWWGEGIDSGFERFDSWEELERRYHEVFRRLLDKGVLRDALLRRGDRQVHRWPTPSSGTTGNVPTRTAGEPGPG